MRFDERRIIVTGGAKGIGAAAAVALVEAGAKVWIFDIDRERGEALTTVDGLSYVHVDIADADAVCRAVDSVTATVGSVDGLVNNAGIAPPLTLENMTREQWARALEINLTGTYHCIDAVVPGMKRERSGSIVNISSVAGKNISLGAGFHYTTSKWGLIGLSRHLAYELAPYGIRVNVVCPGPTLTSLIQMSDDNKQKVAASVPLGRWVRPEDVANAIAFFLSPLSAMCTGAEIVVDGGTLLGSGQNYNDYFISRGDAVPPRDIEDLARGR